MGASSSGLLDEAKINTIKGLVDSMFQSFSDLYHHQYLSAYCGHLQQEVEPKTEGRGLLLTQRPQYDPEQVFYQGSVKFCCWFESGKKFRDRYVVLRRSFRMEIHDNMEMFNHGSAAKLVLQPAGGSVFTTEEECRAHLEHVCSGILHGVKEDSSLLAPSPDGPLVFLHLPYSGFTCFLFQQEEERAHFLSALQSCIRHCNLDPWSESSFESHAFIKALQRHHQDRGYYESWEVLLGTEEQVLTRQVMEEVLAWLQSQLQSRVKGKKAERIRQWLTTLHASSTLVQAQVTTGLEALKEKCRQTASANQTLMRSNLDQITSSLTFLEERITESVSAEADSVYRESVSSFLPPVCEVLTENIGSGLQKMKHTLKTHMDSAFTHSNGGTDDTKKALLLLRSISLDQNHIQMKNLMEILGDLRQRFGVKSVNRLIHAAHLEMEKLLDSAVYTLELFLRTSARLDSSEVSVKMERAKERVLKQLDYDSRLVQMKLFHEILLEISLPVLVKKMNDKWKTELQKFEQHIFSDFSSFILVHNVYDAVLRNFLRARIETVLQESVKKKNLLLTEVSALNISQYSLLDQTPPPSVPHSPDCHSREDFIAEAAEEPSAAVEEKREVKQEEKEVQTAAPQTETKPDLGSAQTPPSSSTPHSPDNSTAKVKAEEPSAVPMEGEVEKKEMKKEEKNNKIQSSPPSAPHSPDTCSGADSAEEPSAAVEENNKNEKEEEVQTAPSRTDPESHPETKPDLSSAQTPLNPDGHSREHSTTQVRVEDPAAVVQEEEEKEKKVQTLPPSAPHSADGPSRDDSSAAVRAEEPSTAAVEEKEKEKKVEKVQTAAPQSNPEPQPEPKPPLSSAQTMLVKLVSEERVHENMNFGSDSSSEADSAAADCESPNLSEILDSIHPFSRSPEPSLSSLLSLQFSDVSVEEDQSDRPSSSDLQPPCPPPPSSSTSPPPGTECPPRISLESLNKAITHSIGAASVTWTMTQQTTDRAIYLTGCIRDSWTTERLKERKQEGKGGEEGMEVEERTDGDGGADQTGGVEEEKGVLQMSQPELPVDTVRVIRELVTEVIEVETEVKPCPDLNG